MQLVDALVCVMPGQLQLSSRQLVPPGPGDALVRPRRVGICGTDYHIFEGKHPYLEYPRVMGHELAVEVVEAPAASPVSPGEICVVNPYISCGSCNACRAEKPNCCVNIAVLGVHRDGGMAGLLCVPASNLLPAQGLSIDECASVEFLSIGAHAVRRGQVRAGDRALVVGAGPIGLGVAIFARLAGADVFVLDLDSERASAAVSLVGATAVPPAEQQDRADKGAGGDFDVVFDATGNRVAMETGFSHVAHGGRYVLVSVVNEAITFMDPDFHRKETTLFGSRNALSKDFEQVIAAIRSGQVPVDRLITHRTTLTAAADDLPRWAKEKSGLIKALIDVD